MDFRPFYLQEHVFWVRRSRLEQQLIIDQNWSHSVLQAILDAVHGLIARVPAPIMQPQVKRALFLKTGVVAVDMESHIVARVAAKHRMSMVAIRVVIHSTGRRLPRVALAVARPNGTLDIGALFRSILKQPHEARPPCCGQRLMQRPLM